MNILSTQNKHQHKIFLEKALSCPHPDANFLTDVLEGLSKPQKTIPCKYFYNDVGARIFEQICQVPEYYQTRTETKILNENIEEIADIIGADCCLVEPGSGSGDKTRFLLKHLRNPSAYVPIDISRKQLVRFAEQIQGEFPEVHVLPVCADYTQEVDLPAHALDSAPSVFIFFPASTIGNFSLKEAAEFLKKMNHWRGDKNGKLLIGVDLKKDKSRIEAAYNDEIGANAAFNLNLLIRMNHELDADFDIMNFRHHAPYQEQQGRVEMRLICDKSQTVQIADKEFFFKKDEYIVTEHCYKFDIKEFETFAKKAGWSRKKTWVDSEKLFSVHYLTADQ